MALTPVEIRHLTPGRGLFGYKTGQTDRLLAEVAASFEDVWRERADLADRVEQLEADLVRYRELETLLRTTLVSAERASADMKEQARKEAELILGEAHAEARAVMRRALAENERLTIESTRLRAQLAAALTTIGEPDPAAAVADAGPAVPADAPAEEPPAPEPVAQEHPLAQPWPDYRGEQPLPDADAA
jgi:cell division initiation protein